MQKGLFFWLQLFFFYFFKISKSCSHRKIIMFGNEGLRLLFYSVFSLSPPPFPSSKLFEGSLLILLPLQFQTIPSQVKKILFWFYASPFICKTVFVSRLICLNYLLEMLAKEVSFIPRDKTLFLKIYFYFFDNTINLIVKIELFQNLREC